MYDKLIIETPLEKIIDNRKVWRPIALSLHDGIESYGTMQFKTQLRPANLFYITIVTSIAHAIVLDNVDSTKILEVLNAV